MRTLAREDRLRAFRHHGFWQPMDTYREYELLNELWNSGAPPWLRQLAPAEPRAG
jgi:glucose-1-phosphate cytidylyltransferase